MKSNYQKNNKLQSSKRTLKHRSSRVSQIFLLIGLSLFGMLLFFITNQLQKVEAYNDNNLNSIYEKGQTNNSFKQTDHDYISGVVKASSTGSSTCDYSSCGGEECNVDGYEINNLSTRKGLTIEYDTDDIQYSDFRPLKITHDNQVTAGIDYSTYLPNGKPTSGRLPVNYPVYIHPDSTDKQVKVTLTYPSRSKALDGIFEPNMNPFEIMIPADHKICKKNPSNPRCCTEDSFENCGKLYYLTQQGQQGVEGLCAQEFSIDTGPFITRAFLTVKGGEAEKKIEFPVLIAGDPSLGLKGDINPDRANKQANILLNQRSVPSFEDKERYQGSFDGRKNSKHGTYQDEDSDPAYKFFLDSDNYTAKIGGSICTTCNKGDKCPDGQISDFLIENYKTDADSDYDIKTYYDDDNQRYYTYWYACRNGLRGIQCPTTSAEVVIDLGSVTGSNYSCEPGHCLDAYDDYHVGTLLNPFQNDTSLKYLKFENSIENSHNSTNDILIRDFYSITHGVVERKGTQSSETFDVNVVHPGPTYAMMHLYKSYPYLSPYEIRYTSSDGIEYELEEIYYEFLKEYWEKKSDTCN